MPVLRCRLWCGSYFAANTIRTRLVLIESEPEALDCYFDAFSLREPVSTSLENASAVGVGQAFERAVPFLTDLAAILSEHG
jgi:hypothetical protein